MNAAPPRPLRILALVNIAWDPRLGAARVWIELAEQWRAAGHSVEKFCLTDAYPAPTSSRPLFALRQVLFAFKAAAFVRRNAARFDVVDALIGALPFSKRSLGFRGLLVARSVGLYLSYERFEQDIARRPAAPKGKLSGRIFYRLIRRRVLADSERAVRHADLLNVPNEEEGALLAAERDGAGRTVVFPYGLAPERARELAATALNPAERLAQKRVCFIGMWSPRKGGHDWAAIINRVRARFPEASFRFLGTMVEAETVHRALGAEAARAVEVVPTYEPAELPSLLRDCTVGAFPSYVEGFGLAVIEKLAAGLPTIAYDTAGPGDILRGQPSFCLVLPGDTGQFADSICRVFEMAEADYRSLVTRSQERAAEFSWPEIARQTIAAYDAALRKLPPA